MIYHFETYKGKIVIIIFCLPLRHKIEVAHISMSPLGAGVCEGVKEMEKSLNVVRESLITYGEESVDFYDLISILIGKDNKETISRLREYPINVVVNFSPSQFQEFPGIGKSIAERLYAAMLLINKAKTAESTETKIIRSPQDVASLFEYLKFKQQEVFCAAYLDVKNKVLLKKELFKGTLDAVIVHPREILKPALDVSAASIVVAHNHPSLEVEPSEMDIEFTKQLVEAGDCMNIPILDHLIIGQSIFSMKEKGYILNKCNAVRNYLTVFNNI